jgi:hypothetical protein
MPPFPPLAPLPPYLRTRTKALLSYRGPKISPRKTRARELDSPATETTTITLTIRQHPSRQRPLGMIIPIISSLTLDFLIPIRSEPKILGSRSAFCFANTKRTPPNLRHSLFPQLPPLSNALLGHSTGLA